MAPALLLASPPQIRCTFVGGSLPLKRADVLAGSQERYRLSMFPGEAMEQLPVSIR
jgi:hypothetical protein